MIRLGKNLKEDLIRHPDEWTHKKEIVSGWEVFPYGTIVFNSDGDVVSVPASNFTRTPTGLKVENQISGKTRNVTFEKTYMIATVPKYTGSCDIFIPKESREIVLKRNNYS
jgi:hypothetical protein